MESGTFSEIKRVDGGGNGAEMRAKRAFDGLDRKCCQVAICCISEVNEAFLKGCHDFFGKKAHVRQ